jgi:hypothetical protein
MSKQGKGQRAKGGEIEPDNQWLLSSARRPIGSERGESWLA